MKQTLLATLAVATVFCSSTVFANPTMSNQGIYLDPSATARYVETIRNQLLEIGVDPEVSEFKIPATTKIFYRCIPGGMGVTCFKIGSSTVLVEPNADMHHLSDLNFHWPAYRVKVEQN